MRMPAVSLAAFLLLSLPAAAQEEKPKEEPEAPPAPAVAKHVNKVTPEAQACIDAIAKAMYSPLASGLRRLEGLMVSTEPSGSESVKVDFRAPGDLGVVDVPKDPPNLRAKGSEESNVAGFVRQLLLESFGIEPFLPELACGEYDAEVAADGDAKVLVLKGWMGGKPFSESRYTLKAEGLPASGKGTEGGDGMALRVAHTFEYERVGEKFLLLRSVKKFSDVPMLGGVDLTNTWVDAGGLRILAAVELEVPIGGPVSTRWKELSVNGVKVELPAPSTAGSAEPGKGAGEAPAPGEKAGK